MMMYTRSHIFRIAKENGVKLEVFEHPNMRGFTSFIITGDPENRKKMIEFLEGFRPVTFRFEYNELDWGE